ncbi:hypothetical protein BB558_003663 [Smittium angustum]|uniref:Uncharacterized protein n=1 Tax=Smittium angustum TaxID=133377 RepID=A0A2U1J5I8_SMIAN|nr:hypothetical protein BB558_003663 [Smittium angustum]
MGNNTKKRKSEINTDSSKNHFDINIENDQKGLKNNNSGTSNISSFNNTLSKRKIMIPAKFKDSTNILEPEIYDIENSSKSKNTTAINQNGNSARKIKLKSSLLFKKTGRLAQNENANIPSQDITHLTNNNNSTSVSPLPLFDTHENNTSEIPKKPTSSVTPAKTLNNRSTTSENQRSTQPTKKSKRKETRKPESIDISQKINNIDELLNAVNDTLEKGKAGKSKTTPSKRGINSESSSPTNEQDQISLDDSIQEEIPEIKIPILYPNKDTSDITDTLSEKEIKTPHTSSKRKALSSRKPKSVKKLKTTEDAQNNTEPNNSSDELLNETTEETSNSENLTNVPAAKSKTSTVKNLGLEDVETEWDDEGEKKVDAKGNLSENREYAIPTFKLSTRSDPDKLYVLVTHIFKFAGIKDSYHMQRNHPSLIRLELTTEEKENLINEGWIYYSLSWRQAYVVTARSFFREFGSKGIKNGRYIIDDYWVKKKTEEAEYEYGTVVSKNLEIHKFQQPGTVSESNTTLGPVRQKLSALPKTKEPRERSATDRYSSIKPIPKIDLVRWPPEKSFDSLKPAPFDLLSSLSKELFDSTLLSRRPVSDGTVLGESSNIPLSAALGQLASASVDFVEKPTLLNKDKPSLPETNILESEVVKRYNRIISNQSVTMNRCLQSLRSATRGVWYDPHTDITQLPANTQPKEVNIVVGKKALVNSNVNSTPSGTPEITFVSSRNTKTTFVVDDLNKRPISDNTSVLSLDGFEISPFSDNLQKNHVGGPKDLVVENIYNHFPLAVSKGQYQEETPLDQTRFGQSIMSSAVSTTKILFNKIWTSKLNSSRVSNTPNPNRRVPIAQNQPIEQNSARAKFYNATPHTMKNMNSQQQSGFNANLRTGLNPVNNPIYGTAPRNQNINTNYFSPASNTNYNQHTQMQIQNLPRLQIQPQYLERARSDVFQQNFYQKTPEAPKPTEVSKPDDLKNHYRPGSNTESLKDLNCTSNVTFTNTSSVISSENQKTRGDLESNGNIITGANPSNTAQDFAKNPHSFQKQLYDVHNMSVDTTNQVELKSGQVTNPNQSLYNTNNLSSTDPIYKKIP